MQRVITGRATGSAPGGTRLSDSLSLTHIRDFFSLYMHLFARFYPLRLSGRLLNTHNDLEGAVKVLASAECGGIGAKTPGSTVVSSHLQTTRLPLSRGGQCERTCAKHHVGKLSALRGTACWLWTNGNSL